MKSILLMSDDPVLECGLEQILSKSPELQFWCIPPTPVGQLLNRMATFAPEILLMDIEAGVDLSTIEEIRKAYPDCSICLWGRSIPDELAYQAMTVGVKGILRRTVAVADLLKCLERLWQRSVWFEERLMAGFFSNRVIRLTRRESQLVSLLAQGLKNKEIAYRLTLSEGTVKVYLSRLFEKLGVKDRFELALYGLRNLTVSESSEPLAAGGVMPAYVNTFLQASNTSRA